LILIKIQQAEETRLERDGELALLLRDVD